MYQPAQYCSKCTFPFKQMGACPKPDASLIYAYLSCLPYVLAILLFIITLITRKLSQIKLSALILSSYVIGDKIVKSLLKNPRPLHSCKNSYGMPSSHMIVITVFGFMRIKSSNSSVVQKLVWFLLILSQGLARIQLNYHTLEQVIAGIIFGVLFSLIFQKIWTYIQFYLVNLKFLQAIIDKQEYSLIKQR